MQMLHQIDRVEWCSLFSPFHLNQIVIRIVAFDFIWIENNLILSVIFFLQSMFSVFGYEFECENWLWTLHFRLSIFSKVSVDIGFVKSSDTTPKYEHLEIQYEFSAHQLLAEITSHSLIAACTRSFLFLHIWSRMQIDGSLLEQSSTA